MWLLTLLGGCGADHQVVWDDAASGDVAEDITVSILTLGTVREGDRALLDVPHAAGTRLEMELSARDGADLAGWTVESLDADVCQVVHGDTAGDTLPVSLLFRKAGATDLFVIDADGLVRDWQAIEVRDPATAEVFAYDALAVEDRAPIETIDVIPGSAATLAVAWTSQTGEPLAGTGLLVVTVEGDDIHVEESGALEDRAFEAFDLVVDDGASRGTGTVRLLAGETPVRDIPVVVHDADEITGIQLDPSVEVDEEDGSTSGAVRAIVEAGDADLLGVQVIWRDDGVEVGTGSRVEFGGSGTDDLHEIQACLGEICAVATVPGHVTSTQSPVAPMPTDSCIGCAQGGDVRGLAFVVAGLLAWARTRRDERVS